jgi:hypothetical protein
MAMAPKRTASSGRTDAQDAPDHIDVGTGPERRSIARVADLYAVHDLGRGASLDRAVLTLDEGGIAVFRTGAGTDDAPPESAVGPVYELHPGGSVGVPTGRVFIRFADAERIDTRREDLARAGYDVERTVSYAPNAAWLKPRTGRIGDGLRGIDALRKLRGVENVEAEVKTERRARE